MLAGQIGVIVGPTTFFETIVSWATKSPAVHVVVAISETTCMSMEREGAVVRPVDHWGDRVVWSDFELAPEQRAGIVNWTIARYRRPYSWLADLAIGLEEVFGWRQSALVGEWLSGDGFYQCSQLGASALFFGAGIRIRPDKWLGAVSPRDFYDYFKERGWLGDGDGMDETPMCAMHGAEALADEAGH